MTNKDNGDKVVAYLTSVYKQMRYEHMKQNW